MNGDNNGHSTPNGQTIQINGTNGPTVVTIPHSMGIQNMPQQPPPSQQQNLIYPHFIQNGMINSPYDYQKMYAYPKYEYYDCDPNRSPQDPYVPPSYSGEAKNEIILQPL
uniref:Uncharacterized protein n=1 Tax=Panagrolaimus davidi TaxID=227884 RepID=A0A914P0W4_9BILA